MSSIANRTIFIRDNLEVMRGINSASVDLVYLDPPFNSKRMFEVPIGSKATEASFKGAWTLDDVISCSKGGADVNGNLQLLCGWCNRTKGARSNEYLRERLVQVA